MTYYVGQRVRFDAEFLDADSRAFDPKSEITATVELERAEGPLGDADPVVSSKTYTLGRGVERSAKGAYSFTITLDQPGFVTVKIGAAREGFTQQRFEVRDRSEEAAMVAPDPELEPHEDEASHAAADDASDPVRTDEMIAFLRERGVPFDPDRGPAYIGALFEAYSGASRSDASEVHRGRAVRQLERSMDRGKTPGDRYRDRQRAGR